MKMFEKLMEKKKQSAGKELDPIYKDSKMSMLKALRSHMSGMMKDDLSNPVGMKKVEVAASDKSGLSDGLDKAKDLIGDDSEESDSPKMGDASGPMSDDEGSMSSDMGEDEEDVESNIGKYLENPSPESIDALLMALQQKKLEMSEGE